MENKRNVIIHINTANFSSLNADEFKKCIKKMCEIFDFDQELHIELKWNPDYHYLLENET